MPLDPGTLIFESQNTPEWIERELKGVKAFDDRAERRLKVFNCLVPLAMFGMFGLFALAAALIGEEVGDEAVIGAFCVFVPIFFGAMIGLTIMTRRLKRDDLDDRRYECLQALLPLLATDMRPDGHVSLTLDLAPIEAGRKQTEPEGWVGRYRVVKSADEWLTLRGRFADGTAFQLEASDVTQLRFHRKKSFKNKRKTVTRITLRLKPKAKRYGALDVLGAQAEAAVKLPPGCQLKKVEFAPEDVRVTCAIKFKTIGGKPVEGLESAPLAAVCASLFLSAYQVLNLSRQVTKRGGSGA